MRSKSLISLLAALAIYTGICVAEDEVDPAPIIEGRQSALRDIGAAFKGISDELKKSAPALALIRQYARQIDDLAKQQHFWFPRGTGPESDIETAAKPDIWEHPAEFKAGQKAMGEQAAKLAAVASGDDAKAIKAQWQALGKTCKGCHDKFREEED